MKNLFDYATRELSQDAFLRWLFENYNCENENVKAASRNLLAAFTGVNPELISDLETVAQWKNIDVSVWFKVSGKEHLLVIEDKTMSALHGDQLGKYNEAIKRHNDWWNARPEEAERQRARYIKAENVNNNIHKVFYKTFEIGEEERKRVDDAKWSCYDLANIAETLFAPFEKTGSEIMDDYLEFVKKGNEQMKNRALPEKDKTWCDTCAWWGFFNRVKEIYKDRYNGTVEKGIYPYSYIYFRPLGMDNGPYLEIRSRDCVLDPVEKNRYFEARLLTYYDNWNNPERKKQLLGLRDRIEKLVNEGQLKRLVHYTKKNEDPKQLACCFTRKKAAFTLNVTDEKAFFSLLDECLADYSKIMDGWDDRGDI